MHHGTSHKTTRHRWIFWCFAAIAAFFLLAEHTAHVLGALPYLLLMLCPLMHIFMHHGHGHHHDDKQEPTQSDEHKP